ncbi:MAG TPA: Fur family transcriptional regulator [Anaerolineales bacterium]|nr:Fur family transcriptional regulator [Anaerolineales bacterium]
MAISDQELSHLRSQGFRLTPQRLAIVRALSQAHDHLTPGEVYRQVHGELPGMTEATVYRTLNFLTEQGLVLVAHVGHGQLVYEIAGHNHHHLICQACGQMQEIDHAELAAFFEQLMDRTGFQVDTAHATFFGFCPECKQEETS